MVPGNGCDQYEMYACLRRGRAGLTALEFVACLIAVVGGAWLGAMYLGVDVRHLAHSALSEAQLLDRVPPQWRPPPPQQNAMTREQLVDTLRTELGSLRSEILALRSGDGDGGDSERLDDTAAPAKERTQAYWLRLGEIAVGETALQQDAETALNEANAAKVFAIKGRISRFAAKTVAAVPSEGVDGAVVQFGQQLAAWYDRGGDLYDRAVQIWELPATSQSRERLIREWRGAELHHRNEARLLTERGAVLRSAISRQFGEEFPEFAKPAEPAAKTAAPLAE